MKNIRSEFGSVQMLFSTALAITSFVAFSSTLGYVRGVFLPIAVMTVMLGLLGLHATYGLFLACRSYRFDEEGVSSHLFGRVRSMRWSDVTEFGIRRFSGDSTLRLRSAAGARLDIDFQLLGAKGSELFSVMTRQLQPLIDAKLEKLGREGGRFANLGPGFIPLPGGLTLSDGILRKGGTSVAVEEIREIRVRRLQKLAGGQEYEIVGDSSSLRLQSTLHDGPLLLLFLARKVPEEQWVVHRPSGIFNQKLLGLIMVPAALVLAGMMLLENAQALAESWSPAGSTVTEATVQAVFPDEGRLYEVVYETGQGDDLISGSVQVLRSLQELPAEGSTITIAYDPDRPYRNRPVDGLRPYRGMPELISYAVFLVVLVSFSIFFMLYKPAEDLFLSWLHP